MALQGKCVKCGIRYVWAKDVNNISRRHNGQEIPLRDTRCPIHGECFRPTVYSSKLPSVQVTAAQIHKDF
jgi:hypothetical protein